MSVINVLLNGVFDVLFAPLRYLSPLAGLVVVSLLTSIAMLIVFKATSDQRRLAAVKRAMQAALFEIRLFNDDPRAVFRAQGEMLRHNLTYLRLSLVPMAWVIVPLVLVMVQLEFHYGYGGLQPSEPVLVKVQLRDGVPAGRDARAASLTEPVGAAPAVPARLETPDGIQVDTPAVWIPATREILWRISPRAAGAFELRAHVGGESFSKAVQVSDAVVRRSPQRLEPGFLNQLLYPSEPPLPGGAAVTAITVDFPERDVELLGWNLHWLIVYFALTMIFVLLLRTPMKVTV